MAPERFYDTASCSLDLAMGFPDWSLENSPLQSDDMADATECTTDILCASGALGSPTKKHPTKAGTGVLMPVFPAAISQQPVLTTPVTIPKESSGNDRELASLLYTSVRQPQRATTTPESPLAGSNISLSSPEMSTEIYRQAQQDLKNAQQPSGDVGVPNTMSLELSSPEMSTEFHRQTREQLNAVQVKKADATASLELSSPDLSSDVRYCAAQEQLLKMPPQATGAEFGTAIYAVPESAEPVPQVAAIVGEASLALPAQNPVAESKDLSQALEQGGPTNNAINSRELSFGNSFAFRQSAAGNSAASVEAFKPTGVVASGASNSGVGLPPRANSPPLSKATSATNSKLNQRDARRSRFQNLLETPGKAGSAQAPKISRAAGKGVGSWKAAGSKKQAAAAPAAAQRDTIGDNDAEAEVQDALRSQLERITPAQDGTAKLFKASAAADEPAAAPVPAVAPAPAPEAAAVAATPPSDAIDADELQQHQKEAEMLLSEMWESLTHNAELFSPSKRASSPAAASPAGSQGDSDQTKRTGSGDSGGSLPPRGPKQAAAGGHRRRNSAISAHGGHSVNSVLDALLNTSGSPSYRQSEHDKMLRDYRPNIDDIMNSYTSNTSARPPRSSGQCAEPAARKRRQRKNKAKMDDLMYASITSGRSFADSAALNTMASTVAGERISVRLAVPSIAKERPEPESEDGDDTLVNRGDAGADEKASDAGSGKASRKKWFKVTGFVCCFTGYTKEAHLHGESMMPPPERLAAKAAAAAAGVTVVPTATSGGLPSVQGTPNSAMSAFKGLFSGNTPRTTPRVSGTQLRNQIRDEMYDPEKETNVLMSCF